VNLQQILAVAIPILIVQSVLLLLALYDLFQEDRQVRGDSKIVWALVIFFVNLVGPLLYFFVGRDESRGAEAASVGTASPAALSSAAASWPRLADTRLPAISTRGLSKRYGSVVALDRLDLDVPSGSIFGFLGPNGAGKTTTLRLLTGLAHASSGTGTVAGVPIGGTGGDVSRHIGYLDQDPRFYGWMRGRQLLELVGRLHGLSGAELRSRVGEVLEIVGLADAANRRIGGYSGGMRQRLGIGQAILNRPQVLFLDEPVSSLDPEGRRDILDVVVRLRGTATVFMSTHILNDVERVCDRVAILNFGRLVIEAPIDDLLERYAQPTYEIEPEPGQDDGLDRLAQVVRGQPWAREVRIGPDSVRVFVSEPRLAGPALLPLVAGTGVTVVRFERVRPSLEDVFLFLVAAHAQDATPGQGGARLVDIRPRPSVSMPDIPVTGLDGRGGR
jgi:ABC-2 type transport system ATP-binding protein